MPNNATGKASGTRDKVLYPSRPEVPHLQDLMPADDLRWSWCNNNRNKCIINVMRLNHLETIPCPTPPQVHGKIVFLKTGPWCQKGWGPLFCTACLLGISLNKFAEPVACHLFRICNKYEERKAKFLPPLCELLSHELSKSRVLVQVFLR